MGTQSPAQPSPSALQGMLGSVRLRPGPCASQWLTMTTVTKLPKAPAPPPTVGARQGIGDNQARLLHTQLWLQRALLYTHSTSPRGYDIPPWSGEAESPGHNPQRACA